MLTMLLLFPCILFIFLQLAHPSESAYGYSAESSKEEEGQHHYYHHPNGLTYYGGRGRYYFGGLQWPPPPPPPAPFSPQGWPMGPQFPIWPRPPPPPFGLPPQYRLPVVPPGQCPPPPYPCPSAPPGPPSSTPQTESTTMTASASSSSPSASTAISTGSGATGGIGETSMATDGTTASGATTTMTSPSQGALSDAQRNAVLNAHNNLRSTLARGTAQNKTGTMPSGTNIIQLAYDTGAETTANSWADRCTFEHSGASERNNSGENLYWTSNLTIPFGDVLLEASNFWWKELVDFGIQASLNLTIDEFNKGIGHWSQMAWRSTAFLGCGVNVCSNATYVVCHYTPAGNFINELVYQSGTACADCASNYGTGASCNTANSLCVVP